VDLPADASGSLDSFVSCKCRVPVCPPTKDAAHMQGVQIFLHWMCLPAAACIGQDWECMQQFRRAQLLVGGVGGRVQWS